MIARSTALTVVLLTLAACSGPRVHVITGTTIGLKATPGDGSTRPPGVTFGYKRGEVALVPTKGDGGTSSADAASTMAALRFSTEWFGHTELDSFIATGLAVGPLVRPKSEFGQELAKATMGVIPDERAERQARLVRLLSSMNEAQARQVLDDVGLPVKKGKTAVFSLQDYIARADTDTALDRLEAAYLRRK